MIYPKFSMAEHRQVLFGDPTSIRPRSTEDAEDYYLIRMIDELGAVAIQLQAKNRDLWDSYDRHQAEVQFRLGISLPFALIVLIFAVQSSPWWLFLLIIPIALLLLGRRESWTAGQTLVQAITLRIVDPPVLARPREVAAQKKEEWENA